MPAENAAEMDIAAKAAETELIDGIDDNWKATDLIDWWHKWFGKAGHKRLGRVLLEQRKRL
jgi:hypothetical protein